MFLPDTETRKFTMPAPAMPDPETTSTPVHYEKDGGVAILTLNRPDVRNAINMATIDRLRDILLDATADGEVRALLLTGAGTHFSAGGDIKAMLEHNTTGHAQRDMLEGVGALHGVLSLLHRLPMPVVVAVNGWAAGAGVGLALHADITWAARSASFTLAFTAIGVSPDSGTTYHLPRAVGAKLASELLLTNRALDAEEALNAGLVSRVLPDDELLPAARELAHRLAEGPTLAYARVRNLVRSSFENGYETQLAREREDVGRSALTHDFGEGLAAFAAKRKAEFRGE